MTKTRLIVLCLAIAGLAWLGQADGFDATRLAWLSVGCLCGLVGHVVLKSRQREFVRWLLSTAALSGLFSFTSLSTGNRVSWILAVVAALFAFLHVASSTRAGDGSGDRGSVDQASSPPNTA